MNLLLCQLSKKSGQEPSALLSDLLIATERGKYEGDGA